MEESLQENTHEDKRFDKINYQEKIVKGRIFEGCSFTGCDLSKTAFLNGRFSDCVFTDCNMSLVKLGNSGFANNQFKGCKLLGIHFSECQDFLFSVSFENCLLDYASFLGKSMPRTVFRDCSLRQAVFAGCNLKGAGFYSCDLSDAEFNGTLLNEADFLTARNFRIDPELNKMVKAKFSVYGLPGLLEKYSLKIEQ